MVILHCYRSIEIHQLCTINAFTFDIPGRIGILFIVKCFNGVRGYSVKSLIETFLLFRSGSSHNFLPNSEYRVLKMPFCSLICGVFWENYYMLRKKCCVHYTHRIWDIVIANNLWRDSLPHTEAIRYIRHDFSPSYLLALFVIIIKKKNITTLPSAHVQRHCLVWFNH